MRRAISVPQAVGPDRHSRAPRRHPHGHGARPQRATVTPTTDTNNPGRRCTQTDSGEHFMPGHRRCRTPWPCFASKRSPHTRSPWMSHRRLRVLRHAHFDACCIRRRRCSWLCRQCGAPELPRSLGLTPEGEAIAYVPYGAMVDSELGLHPSLVTLSGLPGSSMVEHRPLLA